MLPGTDSARDRRGDELIRCGELRAASAAGRPRTLGDRRPHAGGRCAAITEPHLWHPFADQEHVCGSEVTIVAGDGCWVTDDRGRRYMDATASLWYCNIGHGRRELAEAATSQMSRLAAYHTFDVFTNEPARALADRLMLIAPTGLDTTSFFTSGGSEAVETATKLARLYWPCSARIVASLWLGRGPTTGWRLSAPASRESNRTGPAGARSSRT